MYLCYLNTDTSSGTSRDWAFGAANIPYVYTIELRDQGGWGFLLPPEQILPTGRETWVGVRGLALHLLNNQGKKHNHGNNRNRYNHDNDNHNHGTNRNKYNHNNDNHNHGNNQNRHNQDNNNKGTLGS